MLSGFVLSGSLKFKIISLIYYEPFLAGCWTGGGCETAGGVRWDRGTAGLREGETAGLQEGETAGLLDCRTAGGSWGKRCGLQETRLG